MKTKWGLCSNKLCFNYGEETKPFLDYEKIDSLTVI